MSRLTIPIEPSANTACRLISSIEAPLLDFPSNKRPMAGRNAFPVGVMGQNEETRLSWAHQATVNAACYLRLTVAVDERVEHVIRVANVKSGKVYGDIAVRFASPGQVLGLELSYSDSNEVLRDGISLAVEKGACPLWLVAPGPNAPGSILPHLALSEGEATIDGLDRKSVV